MVLPKQERYRHPVFCPSICVSVKICNQASVQVHFCITFKPTVILLGIHFLPKDSNNGTSWLNDFVIFALTLAFNDISHELYRPCTLRKQAYSNILENLPAKYEKFQIKILIFFLCLLKNIDCWYSLEPPWQGGSNEYPQSMF